MAKNFAEPCSMQSVRQPGKSLRIVSPVGQMLGLAQAPLHHFQRDRQAAAGALNEIGSAGRDQRGHFRLLIWRANNYDWRMNGQGGNHGVQARHFSDGAFALRSSGGFLEKDDRGRGIRNDAPGGIHCAHFGNPQPSFLIFKFAARGGAQLGVIADQ